MTVSPIGALMSAAVTAPPTGVPSPGIGQVGQAVPTAAPDASSGSFGNVVVNALQGIQDSQNNANTLAVKAATGDLTDVHQYTIAATEASLQTELTVAVRDRAVQAFNSIMAMQI